MIICKDCRCFHPVTVSDRYCGECVIGDTRNAIEINAEITGCCLFEPKQPKKPKPLTNGDRIRQMTDDEELLSAIGMSCYRCVYNNSGKCSCECNNGCYAGNLEWLRKEADEDATERTD